jgi:hypothetical protein
MLAVLAALPSWGGLPELLLKSASGALIYAALAWLLDLNGVRAPAARIVARLRAKFAARVTP